MSCCNNNKLKHRCGTITPAECVRYGRDLPEWTKLDECVTVDETTAELYEQVDELRDNLHLDSVSTCLDVEKEEGKYPIREVVRALSTRLCELDNRMDNSPDVLDIGKLDFKCLIDPCGERPGTLLQLLQLLIDKVCVGYEPPTPSSGYVFSAAPTTVEVDPEGGEVEIGVESTEDGEPAPWGVVSQPEWIETTTTQDEMDMDVEAND